jgi:hypothetical protein
VKGVFDMTTVSPVAGAQIRPQMAEGAERWEYLVVPLQEVKGLKKADDPWAPDRLNDLGGQGWEAVGLSLKYGDFIAWPVVLLKRPLD